MIHTDPTLRFSARVENYIRYHPGYPPQVVETLRNECGLTASCVIADVACGTGIFTRLLLENGNRVTGVEPNREMREAAERLLAPSPDVTSGEGTADPPSLPSHIFDSTRAAKAAHWFDLPKARQEFIRILKP